MNVLPINRKRYPSENVQTSGGLRAIFAGIFGTGYKGELSSPQEVYGNSGSFYLYHEGDLFTPGTQNWVLDPSLETPLNTQWGHAFLRRPNTFSPIQHPQIYANPNVVPIGIGGQIAGQIYTQPLSDMSEPSSNGG